MMNVIKIIRMWRDEKSMQANGQLLLCDDKIRIITNSPVATMKGKIRLIRHFKNKSMISSAKIDYCFYEFQLIEIFICLTSLTEKKNTLLAHYNNRSNRFDFGDKRIQLFEQIFLFYLFDGNQ